MATLDFKHLVLIGGSQRSGTTLLHNVLCSHPETNPSDREIKFLPPFLQAYQQTRNKFESDNHFFFRDLKSCQQYYYDFLNKTFRDYAERHGVRTLIFKDPHLSQFMPEFWELFPHLSRFLILVRDPRDVIASLLQVGQKLQASGQHTMFVPQNMVQIIAHFNRFYHRLYGVYGDPKWQTQFHFLRYESFVSNPVAQLKEIQPLIGLDFSACELERDWHEYESRQFSSFGQAWTSDLNGQSISPASVGKYRERLTPDQIRQIEQGCQTHFKVFGYSADETL